MILVSLIGGSAIKIPPILFEFKEKIFKHILVYDDAYYEQRKVDRVRKAIDYLNEKHGSRIDQLEAKIDEDNKADIDGFIAELFAQAGDPKDIYFNASDGPANVSIFVASAILARSGHVVVYDAMDNTYNLLYKNNMRNLRISHSMKVKDYCNMMGMEIVEYRRKHDIKPNKKAITRLFRRYGGLRKVRSALSKGDENFPYHEFGHILKDLESVGVIDKDRSIINRNFLFGGMFEEYIYWIMRRLDFDDVMMGVTVALDRVGNAVIKNEFDVLMIKDNHPYIIECKHKRNINGDNLIYKFDAINDAFGPDAKVMIVNISDKPKIKYKTHDISSSFSRGNINRAILNNIEVYHKSRINEKKLMKRAMSFFRVGKKKKKR